MAADAVVPFWATDDQQQRKRGRRKSKIRGAHSLIRNPRLRRCLLKLSRQSVVQFILPGQCRLMTNEERGQLADGLHSLGFAKPRWLVLLAVDGPVVQEVQVCLYKDNTEIWF